MRKVKVVYPADWVDATVYGHALVRVEKLPAGTGVEFVGRK